MRRTYRSKKDTTSVIDRRDLFQNLDAKSSAYDAFSIQNIKQTKRELSCVGSTNALGVASCRVRKKKYVKRIVKEPEMISRENSSTSVYLTPDRSIRVNKCLDPFDLLLMSSPVAPVETTNETVEPLVSKVNHFDQLIQKKEGRTYAGRKLKTFKKYSDSDSSDSDKENSFDIPNVTKNTSDIQTHKLEVANVTPKMVDDSINKIVNNLSLLNKLKLKYSANDSANKSIQLHRHRLTRNELSPLSQKSPLCSTPFKAKYRGESIFKFSPIAVTNKDYDPKHSTVNEDNDESNCSIVTIAKPGVSDLDVKEKSLNSDPIEGKANNERYPKSEADIVVETSACDINPTDTLNVLSTVELSSVQTTEIEPLLGFSKEADSKVEPTYENQVLEIIQPNNSIPKSEDIDAEIHATDPILEEKCDNNSNISDYIKVESEVNENSYENSQSNVSVISNDNEDANSLLDSTDEDKDSSYDTCTSEQSFNDTTKENKEPIVLLQKMNDSSFFKYYEKMRNEEADSDDESSINFESGCSEDCNDSKKSSDSPDFESDTEENIFENKTDNYNDELESNDDEASSNSEEEKLISFVTTRRRNETTNTSMMSIFHESDYSSTTDCDKTVVSNKDMQEHDNMYSDDVKFMINTEANIEQNAEIDETLDANKTVDCLDDSAVEQETNISFTTTRISNITDRKYSIRAGKRSVVPRSSTISSQQSSLPRKAKSTTPCYDTKPDVVPQSDMNWRIFSNIHRSDVNTSNDKEASTEPIVEDNKIIDTNKPVDYDNSAQERRMSFITTRNSNISDRKSSTRARTRSIMPRSSTVSMSQCSTVEDADMTRTSYIDTKPGIVLQPGKKWERSLSIYRRMTMMTDHFDKSILEEESTAYKGRKYGQSVINTMEMQEFNNSLHNESISSRRSTFVSKPNRSTIRILKDPNSTRVSLCNTTVIENLRGFLNEECDDTIIELSKLSIADQTHEVTVIDNFHDTSNRIATPKDYVLRRCNQTEPILFDECYPDSLLKNCHKIGEGVYGEVYLWRARDGRARVLKIVPIAGNLKVNGENQKDFHEIISEIVIAMELSALRAPIADIERHFDEGKDVETLNLHTIENATDVFNEVLAVRCVYGSYPSRLLDLWDLYDECKGSENDNPAILPVDQQYIVLELANAGQDLESYQFQNAEQAHALFLQVAYGLAVAEEANQFEHRDLHWGNVLIAPTEEKFATFVLRGRVHRVARMGVRATVIDYSLSRVSLRLAAGDSAALYNDLAADESLFEAVGDYQFQVYRLMRDKLGNDWKNFEPYTNILWLHYTVDKMITALRYKRTNTKVHKRYIDKLKGIKNRILEYGSAALFVLTDNEL